MKRLIYSLLSLFLMGQAFAQTPEQLQSYLPTIDSWTITPQIEIFNRDNLYERINGAAPLFLENNFQEMTSMEYTQGDDYITIQAYRHATPEDAFGMYASERSSDMEQYPAIGGEAQGDSYGLFFFSGNVYVKMMASNESDAISETMKSIAQVLAEKIDANPSYPALFEDFPKEGLIPYTTAYITQNYIGHEFLKPAYTADYNLQDRKFQLFVIDAKTSEDAKVILDNYFAFTKQQGEFSEGNLLVKDRYNGNIPIVWKGQYIIGAFDESGNDFPETIYDFLNQMK
jgi:hypothetical protein